MWRSGPAVQAETVVKLMQTRTFWVPAVVPGATIIARVAACNHAGIILHPAQFAWSLLTLQTPTQSFSEMMKTHLLVVLKSTLIIPVLRSLWPTLLPILFHTSTPTFGPETTGTLSNQLTILINFYSNNNPACSIQTQFLVYTLQGDEPFITIHDMYMWFLLVALVPLWVRKKKCATSKRAKSKKRSRHSKGGRQWVRWSTDCKGTQATFSASWVSILTRPGHWTERPKVPHLVKKGW